MSGSRVTRGHSIDAQRGRRNDHAVGLFVIEKKTDGRWYAHSTRRTVRAAQNCAWELLTREGGEVRVRKGRQIVAKGVGLEPA